MMCYNTLAVRKYACFRRFGPVAQLGERTVRIREVRGFDPLQVHHVRTHIFDTMVIKICVLTF